MILATVAVVEIRSLNNQTWWGIRRVSFRCVLVCSIGLAPRSVFECLGLPATFSCSRNMRAELVQANSLELPGSLFFPSQN